MSGHFKGIIDYVVVYHAVDQDFSSLPPPTMDSPVRPTAEFVDSVKEQLGEIEAVNKKVLDMVEERMKPYEALRKRKDARREELLGRDKGYIKAKDALAAAEEALEKRKRELTEQFNERFKTVERQAEIDKMQAKLDELNREVRELENKAFAEDNGWHTRPGWDGSTRWDAMAGLDEYPLVRKWLKRVGGWRGSE